MCMTCFLYVFNIGIWYVILKTLLLPLHLAQKGNLNSSEKTTVLNLYFQDFVLIKKLLAWCGKYTIRDFIPDFILCYFILSTVSLCQMSGRIDLLKLIRCIVTQFPCNNCNFFCVGFYHTTNSMIYLVSEWYFTTLIVYIIIPYCWSWNLSSTNINT